MSSDRKVWHRSNFVHTEVLHMYLQEYFCAFNFKMRKRFNEDSNIIADVGKGIHVQMSSRDFLIQSDVTRRFKVLYNLSDKQPKYSLPWS